MANETQPTIQPKVKKTPAAKITPIKPTPAASAPEAAFPVISDSFKYKIRDAQLKRTLAETNLRVVTNTYQQAGQVIQNMFTELIAEYKIDIEKVSLNLDTLEFEKRAPEQQQPAN